MPARTFSVVRYSLINEPTILRGREISQQSRHGLLLVGADPRPADRLAVLTGMDHVTSNDIPALIRCTAETPMPTSQAVFTMPVPFAKSSRTIASLSVGITCG